MYKMLCSLHGPLGGESSSTHLVAGLFYSQSSFAAVLYLVSKVKKPASRVQILSSRKENNMILTSSDRKMNKWDK